MTVYKKGDPISRNLEYNKEKIRGDTMYLENLRVDQVKEYFTKSQTVVITIGSIENHGEHNPLGVDTIIPRRILERLETKCNVLIAPIMPYGCTDSLENFAGTINLGYDVTYLVMQKIIESLYRFGARQFIILNGHGGNLPILNRLGLELRQKQAYLYQINWWQLVWQLCPNYDGSSPWQSGHGGAQETSAVLAYDESLVDMSKVKDLQLKGINDKLKNAGYQIQLDGIAIPVPRYIDEFNENGWIGEDHPKHANKQWGKQLIEETANFMAKLVHQLGEYQ